MVDTTDEERIEIQTVGGNNVTLWDGNDTTPARIEVTTPGGHTVVINDDPQDQSISMTTKLGHTLQLNDVGKGQFISLRSKNGCEMKLDDLGSGGEARVALNTQHGIALNMLDESDSLFMATRGGSGLIMKDSSQVGMGTATGFRVDFGSASQKCTLQCPASGTMDILCMGSMLTVHSDGDLTMSANGTLTLQGTIVKIN